MKKKLTRSNDRMLCGVCGGIAEYFEVDASLIRLAAILGAAFHGAGILAYIIAAIVIPKEPQIIND